MNEYNDMKRGAWKWYYLQKKNSLQKRKNCKNIWENIQLKEVEGGKV